VENEARPKISYDLKLAISATLASQGGKFDGQRFQKVVAKPDLALT